MRLTFLKTSTLLALAALAWPALADPPARVGRISSAEGQVIVHGNDTDDIDSGLLNWPVTTDNRITTMRNARAEFRVGASAVRLAGDSELEVTQLDDDNFKLRLHYGSVSVRIRNAEVLPGFELETAQARVRLQQTGWIRVDAERPPGTSAVSVLEGVAEVGGASASLSVRAGTRAELSGDEVRTGQLLRDDFDNWPEAAVAAAPALRYVTQDITGYEELDRYGSWSDDAEYGPLWLPRSLPAGWAPYRDGRWTWLAPWGWTWVDNAPWGYAPSHYGRWVQVGQRWSWAPGRARARPVWAPALVGWVGGKQWQVNTGVHGRQHPGPAVGWFPLSPRDKFVPGYRVSPDYERRINTDGRWTRHGERRDGMTVVPHEQFGNRRTVQVGRAASLALPPAQLKQAPLTTAPQPGAWQRPAGEARRPDWKQQRNDANRNIPAPAPIHVPALPAVPAIPAAPPVGVAPRHERETHRPNWNQQRNWPNRRDQLRTETPAAASPVPVASPSRTQLGGPGDGGRTFHHDPQRDQRPVAAPPPQQPAAPAQMLQRPGHEGPAQDRPRQERPQHDRPNADRPDAGRPGNDRQPRGNRNQQER